MALLQDLRSFVRICQNGNAWRPSHGSALLRGVVGRRINERAAFTDDQHLEQAMRWLARAQDASRDGGVAGRYHLKHGWTSSYPETTGYIIPTLIAFGLATRNEEWIERAQRAVDFLLGVQLPEGGFPGQEIAENRTVPSIFNSGQIICGLTAWYRHSGDERALAAALRAGAWMAAAQETDGTWRRWIYGNHTYTYMAYAAGWLAQLGKLTDQRGLLDAAERHLSWVLGERVPDTGWFRRCGFEIAGHSAETAFTHTIAYTLAGVLELSRSSGNSDGVAAVREAAMRIARTLELKGRLPGTLNHDWRSTAAYACLTGNAQMALIWFDLHRDRFDPAFVSAACKAIDLVKNAQPMRNSNPGIRGGIPASDPLWGDYVPFALPNWAAKYFVDALLAKREVLSTFEVPSSTTPAAVNLPTVLPARRPRAGAAKVVLLAGPWEERALRVAQACQQNGVRPLAVIVEQGRPVPLGRRIRQAIREEGFGFMADRVRRRAVSQDATTATAAAARPRESLLDYCRACGIDYLMVERLDSDQGAAMLLRLAPDVAVHAGAGILRRRTVEIPQLGVVNAHMGILPPLRGMNVVEWSVLFGFPVGCSVHLIDDGVDTGDILCCRFVETAGTTSIQQLRDRVDNEQLALLGEVIGFVADTGTLPPRLTQEQAQGRQFFRMHAALRTALEKHLRSRAPVSGHVPLPITLGHAVADQSRS